MDRNGLFEEIKNAEKKVSFRYDASEHLYVRLDGKNFSKWTKRFDKPFDPRLANAMAETTKFLVSEYSANFGYTQSDEITLYWAPREHEHEFGGKHNKLVSLLSSQTTLLFNKNLGYPEPHALFDARAFTLDHNLGAPMGIYVRWLDARRNGVNQLAHHFLSKSQTNGVSTRDRKELLAEQGVNINDYPDSLINGVLWKRERVKRFLTQQELDKIKPEFRPTDQVERWDIVRELDIPTWMDSKFRQ